MALALGWRYYASHSSKHRRLGFSAGAGIQADLKTCAALGVYCTTAITAVTAQNTEGVGAVHEMRPDIVAAQIDAVVADIRPEVVKTGMLASASIVEVVAERVGAHRLTRVVVDPVMIAKSGDRLLREDAIEALRRVLIPLAEVVTPNIPEAEVLVGRELRDDESIRAAAREIAAMGAGNVVMKGGHREGDVVVDLLFDGIDFHEFSAERVLTTSTHGTGCTFASATACFLARGESISTAVAQAKEYVTEAIRRAQPIGRGRGPLNHFWGRPGAPDETP